MINPRVSEIERHYFEYNKLPPMSPDEVMDSALISQLSQRGVAVGRDIDEEQLSALIAVTNFDDRRSRARKLSDMGISVSRWNGWKRNPRFKALLEKFSTDEFNSSLNVAHEGLVKAMDRGQTEAIKFYMEHTGRAETPKEQNLKVVVTRLVESIQRHVRDPEVLKAIGNDLDRILNPPPKQDKVHIVEEPQDLLGGSL